MLLLIMLTATCLQTQQTAYLGSNMFFEKIKAHQMLYCCNVSCRSVLTHNYTYLYKVKNIYSSISSLSYFHSVAVDLLVLPWLALPQQHVGCCPHPLISLFIRRAAISFCPSFVASVEAWAFSLPGKFYGVYVMQETLHDIIWPKASVCCLNLSQGLTFNNFPCYLQQPLPPPPFFLTGGGLQATPEKSGLLRSTVMIQ